MLSWLEKSLLEVCERNAIPCVPMPPAQTREIMERVQRKYKLDERADIQISDARMADVSALAEIVKHIQEEPLYLFVKAPERSALFEFQTSRDVALLLSEMFLFEYFLTNSEATFLLAETSHDALLLAGEAREWLA